MDKNGSATAFLVCSGKSVTTGGMFVSVGGSV